MLTPGFCVGRRADEGPDRDLENRSLMASRGKGAVTCGAHVIRSAPPRFLAVQQSKGCRYCLQRTLCYPAYHSKGPMKSIQDQAVSRLVGLSVISLLTTSLPTADAASAAAPEPILIWVPSRMYSAIKPAPLNGGVSSEFPVLALPISNHLSL